MEKNNFRNILLGLVCVCLAICSTTTSDGTPQKPDAVAQSSETGSSITVNRSSTVGSGVYVSLSVDGKKVRTLIKGSVYRGTVSPGKHVISVMPDPNTTGQRENKVDIVAEKGRSCSLTATRAKSGELVLIKNP